MRRRADEGEGLVAAEQCICIDVGQVDLVAGDGEVGDQVTQRGRGAAVGDAAELEDVEARPTSQRVARAAAHERVVRAVQSIKVEALANLAHNRRGLPRSGRGDQKISILHDDGSNPLPLRERRTLNSVKEAAIPGNFSAHKTLVPYTDLIAIG